MRSHRISGRQALLLVILSVVYFAGAVLRARAKPLWFDEILVVLAARQGDLFSTIKAATIIDPMPPLLHVTAHGVGSLLGFGEIALRIPSIIGFWVFCASLFVFAFRRVGFWFALVAALAPFATQAEYYSTEARSYAMLLGFCGIAMVSWQAACEQRNRWLPLLGISVGMGGALLCHSYALMIYVPLAGAELYRSLREKRIDFRIWMAFAAAAVPFLLSLGPTLAFMQSYKHPWSTASVQDYTRFYVNWFGKAVLFAVAAMVILVAGEVFWRKEERAPEVSIPIPGHELVMAALLLVLPLVAITVALIVPPHFFTLRYAAPATAGFALTLALLASQLSGGRKTVGICLALAAAGPFLRMLNPGHQLVDPFQEAPLLARAMEHDKVVVDNSVVFLPLWYYAPDKLKSRILYLTDEESSIKYIHADEGMRAFRVLNVPVEPYNEFASPGNEFIVYEGGNSGWLPKRFAEDRDEVTELARDGTHVLLDVKIPANPLQLRR